MEHIQFLQSLGLAKNEARIYETLLREGELNVGAIANKSGVHRRNTYDTLNRLLEKGLVFEILESKENRYQAVPPTRFAEMIEEHQADLEKNLPKLEKLYRDVPQKEATYILRGIEGWKAYMRDIIRVGQDDFIMAGKGVWANPELKKFAIQMQAAAAKKGINFHVLFDADAQENAQKVIEFLKPQYRFLPKGFESYSAFEVFGDHIVFLTDNKNAEINEDYTITVIINQKLADSFRTWFKLIWSMSAPPKK